MAFFQNTYFKESYNMAAGKSQSNNKRLQKTIASSYQIE